jgi:hypothetical protein
MRGRKPIHWLLALALLGLLAGILFTSVTKPVPPLSSTRREAPLPQATAPTAAESLLEGYADPATEPIDDMRKIHRVVTGYFSLVKDSARNPIGGNADLAAALRGDNPNREIFLPAGHPIFSADGLLLDRWNTPLIVHPEAWRELELRSAGPDKTPYTTDDLILLPNGHQAR